MPTERPSLQRGPQWLRAAWEVLVDFIIANRPIGTHEVDIHESDGGRAIFTRGGAGEAPALGDEVLFDVNTDGTWEQFYIPARKKEDEEEEED